MTPTAASSEAKRDSALVAAVDVAREAVEAEVGAAMVGDHVAVVMEDERLATHTFECRNPGYVGWTWAVTVARAPRAKLVTVNEVVLLPGPDAIVAPEWLPWSERVRPGDLGPGDVLPADPDDQRLVPGFTGESEAEPIDDPGPLRPDTWELGLGRVRVLSPVGRDDAADRWVSGDFGPTTPMARQAPHGVPDVRVHAPDGGPARPALRRVRQRAQPGRRPCGGAHLRLRRPLGDRGRGRGAPGGAQDELGWDPLELGHS